MCSHRISILQWCLIFLDHHQHQQASLEHGNSHKNNNNKNDKSKGPQSSGQMNMRGVYLHILGDALGSVIVIIAALVIKYFDGDWTFYVDPVMR